MTSVVYVIRDDQPVDIATFLYLPQFVPEEKKERILRQRVKQNADNMLVGAVLAKYMLLNFLGIPVHIEHISYGRHHRISGRVCHVLPIILMKKWQLNLAVYEQKSGARCCTPDHQSFFLGSGSGDAVV